MAAAAVVGVRGDGPADGGQDSRSGQFWGDAVSCCF